MFIQKTKSYRGEHKNPSLNKTMILQKNPNKLENCKTNLNITKIIQK